MGHVKWTPIVREPREAEGTALGKRTIGAALRAVAAAWKTFREGLRSKSVPLLPPARGTEEGDKTKDEFQVQNSVKLQPHESQLHWLGYCLALLEDLESIYKKTFSLFQERREVVTEQKLYCFQ